GKDGVIVSLKEFVKLISGGSLTSTGSGALVQLDGTSVFTAAALNMTSSTMTLAGPLATVTNVGPVDLSTITVAFNALGVTSPTSQPFLSFTNSSVDAAGDVASVRRSVSGTPTRLTLAGPLLSATNSTFNTTSLGFGAAFSTSAGACCNTFNILQGAQVSSTG